MMCQLKDSIVIEVISFNANEMTQQPVNRGKMGIFFPQMACIGTCKLPEFPVVAVVDVVHPHAMYTIALLTFVYVQNVGITYVCRAEYPFNKFRAMPTVAVGPNQISRTKYTVQREEASLRNIFLMQR
jgi:hypothetical protein